jgi:hypothetical protein
MLCASRDEADLLNLSQFNEKKRRLEQSNLSGARIRTVRVRIVSPPILTLTGFYLKSDFLRTLTSGLRELRLLDSTKRQQTHVPAVPVENSESDDDEYQCRRRPSRRRKTSS